MERAGKTQDPSHTKHKHKRLADLPEKTGGLFSRRKVTFENDSPTKRVHPKFKVQSRPTAPVTLTYSARAIASRLGLPSMKHTLQHSAAGIELAAIFVFASHHPLWTNERKLFCNTNLALLNPNDEREYPVFERSGSSRGTNSVFAFLGWACISSFVILQPESPELFDMMEVKWGTDRMEGPYWDQSFRKTWAIVALDVQAGMLRDPMRD